MVPIRAASSRRARPDDASTEMAVEMSVEPVAEAQTTYTAVPLEGLAGTAPLSFPLYLHTAAHAYVLYRDRHVVLAADQIGRLQAEGVHQLFVRDQDRAAYYRRVENALEDILHNRMVPLERRALVLYGVAVEVAGELLRAVPDAAGITRARHVMMATSGLMVREAQGFQAVRRMLAAGSGLTRHALTVGFLSMGLARYVLGAEPNVLLQAGLAGLLHDVGRIGHEDAEQDQDHTQRGFGYLRGLALPAPVCEAALLHHERFDGSGYPRGLRGQQIPEMARLVGLVDTFDKVHSSQQPRVGVFDALRIMAQAYRGCFDDHMAQALVKLFRH